MSQNYGSTDRSDIQRNLTNLIQRIRTNLQNVRQITQTLNDLLSVLGGPHDSPGKQDDVHRQQVKANQLLMLTKSLFESLSQIGAVDQDCRLQVNRVKEEYELVIRRYGETYEKIVTRMNQIVSEKRQTFQGSLVDTEELSSNQTQMLEYEEDLQLAQEVERRVQQLEKDMINVQKMYTDINEMVVEDRQMVDNIALNVESADQDLDQANIQLLDATVYKRKALKKKIIIILIVLVVLTVIGLAIGLSVKSNK